MNKGAIKSIIIKLRQEGKTFQEIANTLEKEYAIKMSRQAVHGMYKRAVFNSVENENINTTLAVTDIINYNAIGLKPDEIKKLIKNNYNISLPLDDIIEIPFKNEKYKKSIYKEKIDKFKIILKSTDNITNIQEVLGYKGEPIRDKAFNQLVSDYVQLEIKNKTIQILSKTYNLTNNKALVKDVANKFNISFSMKDLEKVTIT